MKSPTVSIIISVPNSIVSGRWRMTQPSELT